MFKYRVLIVIYYSHLFLYIYIYIYYTEKRTQKSHLQLVYNHL